MSSPHNNMGLGASTPPLHDKIAELNAILDNPKSELEVWVHALNLLKIHQLEGDSKRLLEELKERQQRVADLHDLLKKLNSITDNEGRIDFSAHPEAKQLVDKYKGAIGWEKNQNKLSRDEKDQLINNIRMTVDDLGVNNDMQLQEVTRLTNERYECYQMARAILKPLDDLKKNMAKGVKGA